MTGARSQTIGSKAMTARKYYLQIKSDEYECSSLTPLRFLAMDHIRRSSDESVPIYTSSTKKILVGTVMRMPQDVRPRGPCKSQFIWRYRSAGCEIDAMLLPHGGLSRTNNRRNLLPPKGGYNHLPIMGRYLLPVYLKSATPLLKPISRGVTLKRKSGQRKKRNLQP